MGIGPWHLLALVIIVLVFFGPSRLPNLGKSVGEAIRGFKKGLNGDEIDVTDTQIKKGEGKSPADSTTGSSSSNNNNQGNNRSDA